MKEKDISKKEMIFNLVLTIATVFAALIGCWLICDNLLDKKDNLITNVETKLKVEKEKAEAEWRASIERRHEEMIKTIKVNNDELVKAIKSLKK
jgi:hypothetical protein